MKVVRRRAKMTRYYFDLREGDILVVDEEGLELPDIESVHQQAAKSVLDMAKDAVVERGGRMQWMAIDARDDEGPVLQAKFTIDIKKFR
jgi:hypothetical protein